MNASVPRYRSVSSWLKAMFGETVRKISLDAGLGCPNRDGTLGLEGCLYCNPRGSGTAAAAHGLSITEQIDRAIDFLSPRYRCRKFIAYFQSFTNTYGEPACLREIYGQALQRPEVVGMAIGTRPDCVPEAVLDLLTEFAPGRLVWVEYGLQSIHSATLNLINRAHGPDAFFDAVARTRRRGIPIVVHLILGLPEETLEDMLKTAAAVADSGVQGVKLHPLYVIRGTGLERLYRDGAYQPMTEEQATEATLAVLSALPPEMVVHRLTSDPHAEELVEPLWMLDRRGVRRRLEQAMEREDFRQGSVFGPTGRKEKDNPAREPRRSEATPR